MSEFIFEFDKDPAARLMLPAQIHAHSNGHSQHCEVRLNLHSLGLTAYIKESAGSNQPT
jgi:hypothetical protein